MKKISTIPVTMLLRTEHDCFWSCINIDQIEGKKPSNILFALDILRAEIGVSFSFVILDFPRRFKLLVFSFSFFFALSQSIFMSEKAAVFLS